MAIPVAFSNSRKKTPVAGHHSYHWRFTVGLLRSATSDVVMAELMDSCF
jgi:hypothetical protein